MAEAAVAVSKSAGPRAAVIRSGLLSMLALAALGVTRLVHSALVGRNTDESTFALVGTLIGVTMTAGLFLPGGLSSAAAKFIPYHLGRGDSDSAGAVYRLLSWAGRICAVTLGVLIGLGSFKFGVPAPDAFGVGLLTATFSLYGVEKSALYGFDKVDTYVRLELIGSGLAILATVVVVALGWGGFLMPLALGYSVLIFGAWVSLRGNGTRATAKVAGSDRREMAGYVGLASIGGLAGAGLLQALPLIAGVLATQREVVYFVTAVTLVAPLYFLPRALSMALFPAMAHAHGAGDLARVRNQADLSTRALFVLLAPLFAAAVVLSRQILIIVYGPRFADGAIVLQVLLLATYVMVTQVPAINALSSGSAHEVRIPVISMVSGCLVGVAAAVPLGMAFGGVGVGFAYVLAAVIGASGPVVVVARRYKLAWLRPIGRSTAAVVVALVLAQIGEAISVAQGMDWLKDIGLALLAGALAAVILRRDIRDVIGGRLWKRSGSAEVKV